MRSRRSRRRTWTRSTARSPLREPSRRAPPASAWCSTSASPALLRQVTRATSSNLGPAPDPFLPTLVRFLLPERDVLLERVDRLLARSEGILAVRRRNGDHDARLADLHATRPVVDRDLAHVVARLQPLGDLRHDLLGHLLVRLVVEVEHGAPARLDACRAHKRRDCAGPI